MTVWNLRRERAVFALSLFSFFGFLFSGCAPQSPEWQHYSAKTASAPYRTDKIYLAQSDPKGIDVEVVKSTSGDLVYASVQARAIPANQDDRVDATLISDLGTLTFSAFRLAGGQRFLLPDDAAETLKEWLRQSHACTLTIGSYSQPITARGADKIFATN